MKPLIGLILIIAGIILGIYVGLYLCFIGGIIGLIEAVRAPELLASKVAWSIAKIVFASFLGWLSAFVLIFPGWYIFKED